MPMEKISLGQLVSAAAGRDIGQNYVVVGIASPSSVLVADGRRRSIKQPKKKNIRHINIFNRIAEDLALKLHNGEQVTDGDIRLALAVLCRPDNT